MEEYQLIDSGDGEKLEQYGPGSPTEKQLRVWLLQNLRLRKPITVNIAKLRHLVPKGAEQHGPCATNASLCASRDYALNFWLHDEVHPSTIVQGLMANDFIRAVNLHLGTEIAPLSDLEILENASTFVPEPGAWLSWTAVVAALGLAWRRSLRRCRASRNLG